MMINKKSLHNPLSDIDNSWHHCSNMILIKVFLAYIEVRCVVNILEFSSILKNEDLTSILILFLTDYL